MGIAENIIGTHYRYPDYFEVNREKIREFARAVKDDLRRTTAKKPPRSAATTRWWPH